MYLLETLMKMGLTKAEALDFIARQNSRRGREIDPDFAPSENFGKKEGFDMGDLFGNKSIFNKYENQETVNPFGDERYEVLQDYGIIDENWNLYDMNLGDK